MATKKGFIAVMKHNSSSDGDYASKKDYDKAVDAIHKHFLSYDFEIKDGKPFDSGNFLADKPNSGFDCFSNVTMHKGKVAGFTHCDGDGPVGEIRKSS